MSMRMNVQQLISLGMAMLMAHPALMAAPEPRRKESAPRPLSAGSRPAAPAAAAAAAPAPGVRKAVAAQAVVALSGESVTTLPDGRVLTLGGQSGAAAAGRAALKPLAGAAAQLAVTLRKPRAYHTATVLPDGTVLVLGGLDRSGLVADAELFDPGEQEFTVIASGLDPRAYHTATLLTDGRLLIVGGIARDRLPLNRIDLWNPSTRSVEPFDKRLTFARRGHTARLRADGNVLISGGITAGGSAPDQDEVIEVGDGAPQGDELRLAASTPPPDAREVSPNVQISLRFSRPLQVATVSPVTITLREDAGPVPAKVVGAEAGMLAFLTPDQPLRPNTRYTVAIAGPRDTADYALPPTEISFTTASEAAISKNEQGKSAPKEKDDPAPPPLTAPNGITALAGHSRTSNGKYLPSLTVNLECSGKTTTTKTDSQGRFLLTSATAGHCVMEVDGNTGQPAGKEYGRYFVGVDLRAGVTTVLPYTVWMTQIDHQFEVTIPSPTTQETVITHPRLKGLELRLPAGTVIRDYNGQVITKIGMTPIPIRRPPFPLPDNVNVPIYFTMQPGGAFVEVGGSRYAPGKGAQLIYPNRGRAPAGFVQQFWDYDPDGRGWYIYGQGKVAQNRKSITPDAGVVIPRLTGAMVASPGPWPICCFGPPDCPECDDDDPVHINSGTFGHTATDLVLPDVIPLALTRMYRQNDHVSRAFGIGTSHPYDMALVGTGANFSAIDLALGDGNSIHYTRISPGTGYADAILENSTVPGQYFKSRLIWNGTAWELKLKDGTVYVFQFPAGGPNANGVNRLERFGVTLIRDRYGNTVSVSRDSATGTISRITSPNGRWVAFTYDNLYRITRTDDNGGRSYMYEYDEGGRLFKVTNPLNGVTEYTYDASDQMLTIKDPRGITILTNEYNDEGRVIKQIQADGGFYINTYTEDVNGNVIQTDVVDPRGNVRRVQFNTEGYFSGGYVTSEVNAYGTAIAQTINYERASGTNLRQATVDAYGRRTAYTYDSLGNVLTVTTAAGTVDATTTTYTYDPLFNGVASIIDPLNHTTTYNRDPAGNIISEIDPLSHEVTFTYNSAGQRLTQTDFAGPISFTYDSGNLTAITDPLGNVSRASYDQFGRLVGITDPTGNSRSYNLDALDRVTKITDSLNGSTVFNHDQIGRLTSIVDSRQSTTTYAYDDPNRIETMTDPLSHSDTRTYNLDRTLSSFTDRKGQTTNYTYDALRRLTGVQYADMSTISYTYDAGNRITQIVDSVSGTITRSYDSLDRIISETTPQGAITYTYDAGSRRNTMTVVGQPVVNYTYDNANRLIQLAQGTSIVAIGYDAANRRTSMTLPNGIVTTYSFDLASRLTGINFTRSGMNMGDLVYSYDAAGRNTSIGGSLARTSLPSVLNSANYNGNNQLIQWGAASLSYDLNGNLTGDGINTYTWNARNQLAGIGASNIIYDALGRRIQNSSGTTFLYDGINPVQERVSGNVTANLVSGLGTDEFFSRTDSTGVRHFLLDGLGSTIALTDSAGTVLTRYTYEPFGKVSVTGEQNSNTYQYTSREKDGTGLYFLRARYYDPNTSRFLSEDPIGFDAGPNFYSYVGNMPTNFSDPMGLFTYSDFRRAITQYCRGKGGDWTAPFSSVNWGNTQSVIIARVKAMVGGECSERTLPVDFLLPTSAAAGTADALVIGRHTVKVRGTISVHCDCGWSFSGDFSSYMGFDTFNFNRSDRDWKGETAVTIVRNTCRFTSKPFKIYLPGSIPLSTGGKLTGRSTCGC